MIRHPKFIHDNGTEGWAPTLSNHIVTLGYLQTNYYSKTELQTSGSSSVHYNNITNIPSLITSLAGLALSSGSMIYATSANTLANIAGGTNGQVLTYVAGVPTWVDVSAGISAAGVTGSVQYKDASGNFAGTNNLKTDGTNLIFDNGVDASTIVLGTLTGPRTITIPDQTGYLGLVSGLGNQLAYTNATATGLLYGNFFYNGTTISATETGGADLLVLTESGTGHGIHVTEGGSGDGVLIEINGTGTGLRVNKTGGAGTSAKIDNIIFDSDTIAFPNTAATFWSTFSASSITGNRSVTIPDKSGTLAMLSDIPTGYVTGTGVAGQVSYWNGTNSLTGTSGFTYSAAGGTLTVPTQFNNGIVNIGNFISPKYGINGQGILTYNDISTHPSTEYGAVISSANDNSSYPAVQEFISYNTTSSTISKLNNRSSFKFFNYTTPQLQINADNSIKIFESTGIYNGIIQHISGGSATASYLRLAGQSGVNGINILGDGSALIGRTTNTPSPALLSVYQATSSNPVLTIEQSVTTNANQILFYNPNGVVGSISTNGTTTSFNTTSDYRLKPDAIPLTRALDRLMKIEVYKSDFGGRLKNKSDVFLAHQLQAVVPEAVIGKKDEVDSEGNPIYQVVDQSKVVPLLTAALQEAYKEIELLKSKIQ